MTNSSFTRIAASAIATVFATVLFLSAAVGPAVIA